METRDFDELLQRASEGPGLAVQTNNARRLMIMLRHRISAARKIHPAAYSSLSIITSKSPYEIYILNREPPANG